MEKWFISHENSINKKEKVAKLFLFPYAGGGASIFQKWQSHFNNVQLFSAQYPGRGTRIGEQPIKEFDILIEHLYTALSQIISDGEPYYLFGHSLGTKVIYELALKINKNKDPLPKGMIVSAGKAPCFKEDNPIHHLNDSAFIKEIGRFCGTPKEIIQNMDIMKVFLPMLRADFILDETYRHRVAEKLNIPILGLMGTEDQELTLDELLHWQVYTHSNFIHASIQGGHMFINTHTVAVTEKINDFIRQYHI